MSVKFKLDTIEINLQNPQRENALSLKRFQAQGRSAGGKLYVYEKGIRVQTVALSFNELRQDEKNALEDFYQDVADGGLNIFQYTDHKGITWDAQFLNPSLEFTEIDDKSISSETFQPQAGDPLYPTTTRGDGIWAVDIELELSAPEGGGS